MTSARDEERLALGTIFEAIQSLYSPLERELMLGGGRIAGAEDSDQSLVLGQSR